MRVVAGGAERFDERSREDEMPTFDGRRARRDDDDHHCGLRIADCGFIGDCRFCELGLLSIRSGWLPAVGDSIEGKSA
jgi:hypothetical protein